MPWTWTTHTNRLSKGRWGHTATAINDHQIVVVGGDGDGRTPLKSVEIIDINTNSTSSTINKLSDLPSYRRSHASVVIADYLYVIGGHDGRTALNSILRLNIKKNTGTSTTDEITSSSNWEQIAPMSTERASLAAVAYEGKIFAFGGGDYGRSLDSVECYDVASNSWTMTPSKVKQKQSHHSAVLVGNEIYTIGGNDDGNDLDKVEIFDPITNTFRDGPVLPIPIHGAAAMTVGQYIFVNEGHSNGATYFLDTTKPNDEWIESDTRNINSRGYHAGAVLNHDKLVVCGGWNSNCNTLDTIEYISFQKLTGIVLCTNLR